jgi:hypothetical protein
MDWPFAIMVPNFKRNMIRHVQAILRWFDMESRGEKEGSLDGILAELQHPV